MTKVKAMNTTEEVTKEIEALMVQAEILAVAHAEKLARIVLASNRRKVKGFVMAMGTFFFTDNKGEVLWEWEAEKLKGYEELDNFISDWDSTLKITGSAMRFTEKSETTTDW